MTMSALEHSAAEAFLEVAGRSQVLASVPGDMTLDELGSQIDAAADRDSYDEPYLDEDFKSGRAEQLLEQIRDLERETGEQVIFRRLRCSQGTPHVKRDD